MSIDHTPAGRTRADLAVALLDQVDRRVADPHAIAVAQVHATLAVADVLADIHATLAHRRTAPVSPASPPDGTEALPVRSAPMLAGSPIRTTTRKAPSPCPTTPR